LGGACRFLGSGDSALREGVADGSLTGGASGVTVGAEVLGNC
jgi:hypothetical protein